MKKEKYIVPETDVICLRSESSFMSGEPNPGESEGEEGGYWY